MCQDYWPTCLIIIIIIIMCYAVFEIRKFDVKSDIIFIWYLSRIRIIFNASVYKNTF